MVAPNFYNTVDQGIYNQGYSFIPQERFRGAFTPNTNIGFGSGITNTAAAAPFILPINQGGGGDGGGNITGPVDNSGFDYETDAYGLEDMSAADKGLTDAEQEALDNVNNPSMTKSQIAQIGFGMFTNPLGAIINAARIKKANEQKAIEAAREVATAQRAAENKAAGRGGYQAGYGGDFMDGGNRGRGNDPSDKGGSDSMGSSKDGGIIGYGGVSGTPLYEQRFMYGGRVPYMMGGLANLVDIYD